jgi:hypothetical protein
MTFPFIPETMSSDPDMAPGEYTTTDESNMVYSNGLSISTTSIRDVGENYKTTYRFDIWPENVYKNAFDNELAKFVPISHPLFFQFLKYINLPGMYGPGYTCYGSEPYPGFECKWVEHDGLEIYDAVIKTYPAKYRYRMKSWPENVYKIAKFNALMDAFPDLLKNHSMFKNEFKNN